MFLILAGLVIGVVVFALIVNHRTPDDSAFQRQFEQATEHIHKLQNEQPPLEVPVLKLRAKDFRGAYTGLYRLDGWRGHLEIAGELGEVRIDSDLSIEGDLRIAAGTLLRVHGDVNVRGSMYIAGSLSADNSIECQSNIHCGDSIESAASIFCSGAIGSGRCVRAAGSIMAREDLRAGVEISAGDSIHAGGTIESPVIIAGRSGDPRTITCSRLIRGRVSLGELVETGNSQS